MLGSEKNAESHLDFPVRLCYNVSPICELLPKRIFHPYIGSIPQCGGKCKRIHCETVNLSGRIALVPNTRTAECRPYPNTRTSNARPYIR